MESYGLRGTSSTYSIIITSITCLTGRPGRAGIVLKLDIGYTTDVLMHRPHSSLTSYKNVNEIRAWIAIVRPLPCTRPFHNAIRQSDKRDIQNKPTNRPFPPEPACLNIYLRPRPILTFSIMPILLLQATVLPQLPSRMRKVTPRNPTRPSIGKRCKILHIAKPTHPFSCSWRI